MVKMVDLGKTKAMLRALPKVLEESALKQAAVAELVDARDSKSRSFGVSVRFRPAVPFLLFLTLTRFRCTI